MRDTAGVGPDPGTGRWGRRPVVAGTITVVLLAGAAGLGAGLLPPELALAGVVALAALAGFALIRVATAPTIVAVPAPSDIGREALSHHALRLPRLLYYGGALGIALMTFRLPFNFTLSDWLFLAAFGLTALELLVLRRRLVIGLPVLIVLGGLLFAIGTLISSLQATFPVQSVEVGFRFVLIVLVWFWLGATLLRTTAQVKTTVRLWTVSAAITGAGAVAQLIWGDVIPGTSPNWGRMTGFTPHMNELGGITALALVPALWLVVQANASLLNRVASLVVVGFITVGLFLSGSVGGFLVAAVAVAFWLALGAIRLRTIVIVAGIAAIVAVAGIDLGIVEQAASVSPLERLERVTTVDGEEGTLQARLETYIAAWDSISRSPLVGVGLDDESSRTDVIGLEFLTDGTVIYNQHQVHNYLLGVWYGAGLLAALGALAILVAMVRAGIMALRGARSPAERALTAALLASYVGFLVLTLGTVTLYQRWEWFGSVLLLAVWTQQTRRH